LGLEFRLYLPAGRQMHFSDPHRMEAHERKISRIKRKLESHVTFN
jgi:hypothetical protein